MPYAYQKYSVCKRLLIAFVITHITTTISAGGQHVRTIRRHIAIAAAQQSLMAGIKYRTWIYEYIWSGFRPPFLHKQHPTGHQLHKFPPLPLQHIHIFHARDAPKNAYSIFQIYYYQKCINRMHERHTLRPNTHTHNTFIRHSNMCVRVRPCNPIMVVNGLWPKRAYHGLHGIRLYKYAFFEIRLPISDLLVSWALRFCSAMWCTFSKGPALS